MNNNTEEKRVIEPQKQEKYSAKNYFQFNEVLGYFFRKKDPNRPVNFNLKMMHGINKISIVMFLVAIIVLIIRHLF